MFYCTLDKIGELRWSNACHPKPILLRDGAEFALLESTGLPLGLLDVAEYETKTLQLLPGDKIVMFSDGLTEAESADGEFFDKKRFQKTLHIHAGLGCKELHAKLVESVEEFSEHAELTDDITMLVVEYQP